MTEELTMPRERRKIKASNVVGTVTFLNREDKNIWFVYKTSCKFQLLFRSGSAGFPLGKCMMMYSALCVFCSAYEWTANDVQRSS